MNVESLRLRPAVARPAASADQAAVAVRGEWALCALFGLVLLDSFNDYLLRNILHREVPVNALVPVMVLLVALRWGPRLFLPSPAAVLGLVLLFVAFLIGVVFGDLYSWARLLPIAGIIVSFLVGNAVGRHVRRVDVLANMLLVVGCLYALVCVVALTHVLPAYFPVINAYGFRDGQLVIRPEVTIDQNFQIFYLFFVGLLYFLPASRLRFAAIFVASVAAAYTLARLYTRSGSLLFIAAMAYAWLTPLRYPRYGRTKMVVLPVLFLIFAAWQMDWIIGVTQQIIFRFTDEQSYGTFMGRVYAAEYFFQHILDPAYWIPRGNAEFVRLTGNIPHFTPTAMLLEGGLAGFLAWGALVPVPILLLGIRYFQGRLDAVGILICGGGAVVVAAQMSLNAPLYDHVWLWAGAVVGALQRSPNPDRAAAAYSINTKSSVSVT